jgi:hypothetical protein
MDGSEIKVYVELIEEWYSTVFRRTRGSVKEFQEKRKEKLNVNTLTKIVITMTVNNLWGVRTRDIIKMECKTH